MTALAAQTSQAEEAEQQDPKGPLARMEKHTVEQPVSPRCEQLLHAAPSMSRQAVQRSMSYSMSRHLATGVLLHRKMTMQSWRGQQSRFL